MNKSFKTGDRVISTFGGVTMTVDYLTKSGKYNCKWHEDFVLKEAEFSPEMLQLKNE